MAYTKTKQLNVDIAPEDLSFRFYKAPDGQGGTVALCTVAIDNIPITELEVSELVIANELNATERNTLKTLLQKLGAAALSKLGYSAV